MNATSILYFPDFYHYGITRKADTTFKYECYDHYDGLINVDTLHNTGVIEEMAFVESFIDRSFATGGNISPPHLTKKLLAFVKTDKHTWIEKNMDDQSTVGLKEYPDKITRSDTSISTNKSTGRQQMTIRKYYLVKDDKSVDAGLHEH
jgi:hypothetical protein